MQSLLHLRVLFEQLVAVLIQLVLHLSDSGQFLLDSLILGRQLLPLEVDDLLQLSDSPLFLAVCCSDAVYLDILVRDLVQEFLVLCGSVVEICLHHLQVLDLPLLGTDDADRFLLSLLDNPHSLLHSIALLPQSIYLSLRCALSHPQLLLDGRNLLLIGCLLLLLQRDYALVFAQETLAVSVL